MNGWKPIKPETYLLVKRLTEASEENPFISYAELSELIGMDVQKGARAYLLSARKIVRREYNKVFDVKRNRGIILLTDEEKHVPVMKAALEHEKQEIKRG